tara:strand:- start:74 stop:430 length:357 start_codon:yes stop_codon:yes gene_type:complete
VADAGAATAGLSAEGLDAAVGFATSEGLAAIAVLSLVVADAGAATAGLATAGLAAEGLDAAVGFDTSEGLEAAGLLIATALAEATGLAFEEALLGEALTLSLKAFLPVLSTAPNEYCL